MPPPRLGDLEPPKQLPALDSKEIGDRAGPPEVDQGRVDPLLQHRAVLHQVEAKAGELALLPNRRVRQPDRRRQVALGEHREDPRVDLVGLAGKRRQALHLLGVRDLDRPAGLLEGVVDDPRPGHRLDHRADRLAVDLVDPAGERPQRVDVGGDGELIEMLSVIAEQADVEALAAEIQSGVQHLKGASFELAPW